MRAFQPRPYKKFQENPHWKDYLLFNEYYHGDNGMGLGASHQTGWSDLVANLIDEWRGNMALRKRLLVAVGFLLILIILSVTGYRLLGGSSVTFLQALYMAVITVAGVGYGEIIDTTHNPALRGSRGHAAFLEAPHAATYQRAYRSPHHLRPGRHRPLRGG